MRLSAVAWAVAAVAGARRDAAPPLRLAECRGPKQVKYSAAWFASRALLASLDDAYLNTSRLARPGTMMEGASFLVLEGPPGRRGPKAYKTLDLLDFYVEHLSWYERRLLEAAKGRERAERKALVAYGRRAMGPRVRALADAARREPASAAAAESTIAVMPFFAAGQGQGPSSTALRAAYLNATLASLRGSVTRNVVIAVSNRDDQCPGNPFNFAST